VEVNIYYQGYKEKIEINMIGGQKWNVILEMSEIDWRTREVKMMRCL